ncbi:SusE domain-containing protein [Thermophagus sp. OGC60D27]|uniref:SusE domain-containing protein n=1 Tax=Thermophagus sp. OGC60D27 TaxID=3458415 RepID=UPI0040381BC1
MHKIKTYIHLVLFFFILLISCNEEPEYFTLEVPSDQMKISASKENVILQKSEETEEAISFSWNKASDRGPDIDLVYYLRLVHAEMRNLESELIKIDQDTYTISWTVRELNNLLHAWNITPGDEVTIEAQLFAIVENSSKYMKPEVSKTTFNLIGYDPSTNMFLTVLSNGNKQNIKMNMLDEGVYTWSGELSACEFWFVRNMENGFPAYMKGDTETSLVYSETAEGEHFIVENPEQYYITIDLNNLEVTMASTPINRLFLVISQNGSESITPLNEVEPGTGVFYLKREFEIGTEFRFIQNEEAVWPAYTKGADPAKLEFNNEGSEMFSVDKTATYVMTVNIGDLSLIFLDVYNSPTGDIAVVGDAVADAGWDAGVAIKNCKLEQKDLINRPEVISYTGNFVYNSTNGENAFKFVGDPYWGYQIFALTPNANPFDPDQQYATTENIGDLKWQLPPDTPSGIYTLEFNLHTMKISFFKQ